MTQVLLAGRELQLLSWFLWRLLFGFVAAILMPIGLWLFAIVATAYDEAYGQENGQ